MHETTMIAISVAFLVSAVVIGAFAMPPLTTSSASVPTDVSEEVFEQTMSTEYGFCRQLGERVNCLCFARTSSTILTAGQERVPGMLYMDQTELARLQASESC